jgi:hypothetical protein
MEKVKRTKFVKCMFHPDDDNEFEVDINVTNKSYVCKDCKSKGKKSPAEIKRVESQKNTLMERYGETNPSKIKEVKDKKLRTLKKHQEEDPDFNKNIQEKREETLKNRLGENWEEDLQTLREEGHAKKHNGVKYSFQREDVKEKSKETKLEKYGDENYNNTEKMKETKLEKYGDENYVNVKKIEETNMERRGVRFPMILQDVKNKASDTRYKNKSDKVYKHLNTIKMRFLEKYKGAHTRCEVECLICKTVFYKNWNEIQQGAECLICNPRIHECKSVPQKQIESFLSELGEVVIADDRTIIKPYELDLLLFDKKIAIEYCGLAFHHEDIINKTRKIPGEHYHLYKLTECNKLNFRLITIFEDEWQLKGDIVKERIKSIIGKTSGVKIHGRNCIIREISPSHKNDFLEKFHLQGEDRSVVKLGAFYKDELVSVMTFSHGNISKGSKSEETIWELNRFCSDYNYHIPGIASKLLTHFKRNYEWTEIFSYADRRWSDGNVYRQLGFDFDGYTHPNYWYVNLNKACNRIHRFNLRKRPDEPKDIPEYVLRKNDGYVRIWDCGNFRFKMCK